MNEQLVIMDEVHGNIILRGVYKELVECEDFQRLKDIVQTGTAKFKYPQMKQETRFDHSIGSYYLMEKIIYNIEKKLALQGIKVKEEEKEIAKIAMLLHDVGHGAYSHTLEKITGYSHEKRGIDIVKDENTDIHKILKKHYGEEFTTRVGNFLERVYEHEKQDKPILDIKIENGRVNLEDLLASLISNNIDADRLDYIIRDSKKADLKILTEVDKLIESFEFVLDVDKFIVAIPEEKKILLDMALLERARNYRDIYYCTQSVVGDHVLEYLLEELRNDPSEIDFDLDSTIKSFLTNSKADFSTSEYIKITESPIKLALEKVKRKTQNEKLRKLCDMETMVNSYKELNTDKDEKYIRYLLHKAIPEIEENTKCIIEETRWIKPYKSNESENINIITSNGIEDYKDVRQDLIKLEPFAKRIIAISPEMLRLELGISKKEFDEKYKRTVEEVISTVTKSKDEFELRYVLTEGIVSGQDIKEKLEEKYEIVDSAKYLSMDSYFDNPENYELLENKKTLRVRKGTTFYKSQESYKFKETRATYKTYRKDIKTDYTVRRKEEEIGDSDKIENYSEFLNSLGIDKEKIKPVLEVMNLRNLYTLNVNGTLIDVSFNTAQYINQIYEMHGNIGIIEIKPRENEVQNRLSMLEIREFLENKVPELSKFLSNTNVYEIGMLDTYEKYRKGYIQSSDAVEYEEKHPDAANKLAEISDKAKQREDYKWLNQIPTIEEVIENTKIKYDGEEK